MSSHIITTLNDSVNHHCSDTFHQVLFPFPAIKMILIESLSIAEKLLKSQNKAGKQVQIFGLISKVWSDCLVNKHTLFMEAIQQRKSR